MGILRRKNRHSSQSPRTKGGDTPPNVDWEKQAIPRLFVMGGVSVRSLESQNRKMLQDKLEALRALGPTGEGAAVPGITGYLAVTKSVADAMQEKGIPGVMSEQQEKYQRLVPAWKGRVEIHAWDSSAAGQALTRAGGILAGSDLQEDVRIIRVGLRDPQYDKTGLLQWHADGQNAELQAVFTPEEFTSELEQMRAFAGHLALEVAPDPLESRQ